MAERLNRTRVLLADGTEGMAPDSEVLQGIKTGRWKLPEFDDDGLPMEFVVKDSQGILNAPASYLNNNIDEAIADGIQIGSMEDIERRGQEEKQKIINEAYDAPLSAGVLGAVRGATVGLSDVAIEKLGYDDTLKGLKEANPKASLVGDVAGTVVPVMLAGPASLAGRLASKTGAAAISKLGTQVGSKAAKKIAAKYGLKEGAKKKALELGIGSAVEGALYTGGRSLVDEALLGDEEANYGKVMGDALTGAVFGGAAGASLPILGKALKAGITKASDLASSPKLWTGVRDLYAKSMKLRGGDPKLIQDLFDANKNDQAQLAKYLDSVSSADEDIAAEVNKFMMQADDQLKHSSRIRAEGYADTFMNKSVQESEDVVANMVKMEDDILDAAQQIEFAPARYDEGIARRFATITETFDTQNIDTLRDYARGLQNVKKQVDDIVSGYRAKLKKQEPLTFRERETFDLMQGIRKEADTKLKNYKNFGSAGEKFKLADKLYGSIIEPYSVLRKLGSVAEFQKIADAADPDLARSLQKGMGFDPRLIAKTLRMPTVTGRKVTIKNAQKAIEEQFKGAKNAVSEFMPDTQINANIDKINKLVGIARGVQSLEKQTGRNLAAMVLGGYLGGVPGAVMGQALSNPVAISKHLMNMEKSILKFNRELRGFSKAFEKKSPSLPRKSIAGFYPIIYQMADKKEKDGKEAIIQGLNDGTLFKTMDKRVASLGIIAPKYAAVMQRQLNVAKSLVAQVVPPNLDAKLIKKDGRNLSPGQVRKINEIMVASFSPSEYLAEIKEGRATTTGMEAFRRAHPKLYSELYLEAVKTLTTKKDLPRQSKLRLQYMFDIPVTASLQDIALTQQIVYGQREDTTQAQEPQAAGQVGKPRAKGLDKLDLSEQEAPTSAAFG
jgi:hypothetical protein